MSMEIMDPRSGGGSNVYPIESVAQPGVTAGSQEVSGQDYANGYWDVFWRNLLGLGSMSTPLAVLDGIKDVNSQQHIASVLNNVGNGSMSPLDAQKEIANDPELSKNLTPDQMEYLVNMIEQFNAQQSYDRSIQSIKDSALAQQEAAIATGINPSAYIQGQNAGFTAAKAEASHNNVAMNRFNQKAQMARTMLGLIGGMTSAGIYGSSMMAAKKGVAKLTADASRDIALIKRKTGRTHINANGVITRDIYDYF